jgi:proteasome activator subunit 4
LESKTHLSVKPSTHLGGSKALDSLARMIASTESFFHPTNAGDWTADVGNHTLFFVHALFNVYLQLSAFIKCIVLDFNKRDTCFII